MNIHTNRKFCVILIFCFALITANLSAQQNRESGARENSDSALVKLEYNPLYEINSVFERFEITRQLNIPEMSRLIKKDSGDAWLMMRVMINSGYFNQTDEANAGVDMLKPLYNSYLDSQKLSTLKYILGMAQVSAVGYMAYKHIKKYGFFKRK